MQETQEQLKALLREVEKLHQRNALSKTVGADYFEPGMMEYLDQSEGSFDPETGRLLLRFEARGTRYDGRTEQLEKVNVGDPVLVRRDAENLFNRNNFTLLAKEKWDIGNMPAELCNVIAPLYDAGDLVFEQATISFVEPISKRSRYAKQAIAFVELHCCITSRCI